MQVSSGLSGWPLIAMAPRKGGAQFTLGEFEQIPLQDNSIEAMTSVITDLVRALYEEHLQMTAIGAPGPIPEEDS
jgi:hypothetical protein